jgi:uncharacterized protein (DUF427 family)
MESSMRVKPEPIAEGQESVWSYPRPPLAAPSLKRLAIIHRGMTVADSEAVVRTLETSHPPSYYVPPSDVAMALLEKTDKRSFCEWKGVAVYYDVVIGEERIRDAAWTYPDPTAAFAVLKDHIAFYASAFERCLIDGKPVSPQPGGFYGGWITDDVKGPFKGVPGSRFW